MIEIKEWSVLEVIESTTSGSENSNIVVVYPTRLQCVNAIQTLPENYTKRFVELCAVDQQGNKIQFVKFDGAESSKNNFCGIRAHSVILFDNPRCEDWCFWMSKIRSYPTEKRGRLILCNSDKNIFPQTLEMGYLE